MEGHFIHVNVHPEESLSDSVILTSIDKDRYCNINHMTPLDLSSVVSGKKSIQRCITVLNDRYVRNTVVVIQRL